jgi:tryptophan synthase alpha chain
VSGALRLEQAIRQASGTALVPFVTAGFPRPRDLAGILDTIAPLSDAIEVGIPFSDPLADGVTIRRASERALREGITLGFVLEVLHSRPAGPPVVLMSYLNPLLAFGFPRLAAAAARANVSGLVVPDLPLEESEPYERALTECGIALVQLVSPVTPGPRVERLARESRGFVYAVTTTGTTGGSAAIEPRTLAYLDGVRRASPLPVLAGFGLRSAEQLQALAGHADGAIVGSALIEVLERNEDPAAFLGTLRNTRSSR